MSTLTTQSNFFIRNLLIGHLKVIVNSAQSTGHFINNIPINCNSLLCPLKGHEVLVSSILRGGGLIWRAEIFVARLLTQDIQSVSHGGMKRAWMLTDPLKSYEIKKMAISEL